MEQFSKYSPFVQKHLEGIHVKQQILKNMDSKSWEGLSPAPLEYFQHRMWELWHEERQKRGGLDAPTEMSITFNDINNMLAKAKMDTYAAYPNTVSCKAIKTSEK